MREAELGGVLIDADDGIYYLVCEAFDDDNIPPFPEFDDVGIATATDFGAITTFSSQGAVRVDAEVIHTRVRTR